MWYVAFLSLIIRGCDDIYSGKLALANVVCCCISLIIRGCDDIYSDKLALANVVCCCISLIIRGRDDIYSDKLANLQVNRSCPIYIRLSRLNTALGVLYRFCDNRSR